MATRTIEIPEEDLPRLFNLMQTHVETLEKTIADAESANPEAATYDAFNQTLNKLHSLRDLFS